MNYSTLERMKWGWKELILLLFLVLVLVPVFIEYLLHDLLYNLFNNSLYAGTLTGFIMAVVFMAGLYFIALRPFRLTWDAVGVRSFPKKYYINILLWTAVLIAGSIAILLIMEMMNFSYENEKTESLQSNLTMFSFIVAFVSAAVISPVYEEIFYRGFLYKWFRGKWGVGAGLLLSSIIFTIVHIPTYNTLPVNFLSGLIFAWTYEKSGSVIPGMIVHGVFNGIAVILTATA